VRSGGVEDPRGTKPTYQSLQKLPARSASPKPLCDDCAEQKQPDKHHEILPTAITFQIGRLALRWLAQFGRHLTPSVARIRVWQLLPAGHTRANGKDIFGGQPSSSMVEHRRSAGAITASLWPPPSAAEDLDGACRPSFATKSSTARCGLHRRQPTQMSCHCFRCAVYARVLPSTAAPLRQGESRSPRGAIGVPLE
jgi:hypothetical protein